MGTTAALLEELAEAIGFQEHLQQQAATDTLDGDGRWENVKELVELAGGMDERGHPTAALRLALFLEVPGLVDARALV